jgi:hypothetical protein
MKTLELTPPKLAFVVGTRAVLGTGVGLLLSGKLRESWRRKLGFALLAVGAVTTIPALVTLRHAAH